MKKIFLILSVSSIVLLLMSCGSSGGNFKVLGAPTLSAVTAEKANVTQQNGPYLGSPTYLQMTMYSVWVSTNANCTGLVQVADYGTDGQKFDIFDKPTLFQGNPTAGTYNCMVIKMLDTMNFKPAQTTGTTCVAGNTYTFDIAFGQESWVDKDFHPIVTDANPNTVYLFATTDGTKTAAEGVDGGQTIPLTQAMVSPGQVTLVMDFTDRVYFDTSKGLCWLDSPTMAFK